MSARPKAIRRLSAVLLSALIILTGACINLFYRTEPRAIIAPTSDTTTTIRSPVKVHLSDGSTVMFRSGAEISRERISGQGESFALLSTVGVPRTGVPMDSVVGAESFEGGLLGVESVLVSAAATAAGAVLFAGLMVALFGSCPTVYADTGSGPMLEAEGFSYAVAPLLEHRDVDALRARPGPDGVLRLELRNEALETHFVNHLELLSVRHGAGESVVPDHVGRPVAVAGFGTLAQATDRSGRDVRPVLAERDGVLFSSDSALVAGAREGDLDDWLDLDVADLPPGDSVAVVLRLRNSLLNTVLLYEGMLGGRDALDWLNIDLQRIATAVDLSRWYVRTMGMRASVAGVAPAPGLPFEGIARLGDVGPIAFRDVAIVLPRSAAHSAEARIRLRFVADNWRIDEIRVAGQLARPNATALAVESVIVPTPAVGGGATVDSAAIASIASADQRYLETRPGQRMTLVFHPDAPTPVISDSATTYLIAWQGWYREWVRGSWLKDPVRTSPFVPGDAAMLTALRQWTDRKASLEKEFYASKIPVR